MTSFDFLRKLYKTSKSAVIINNTANTIFWSNNLDRIGTSEEEVKSDKAITFFKKMTYQLYPGEYIANINGKSFTYNVKTFADRTNEFVIMELRTECISYSFINNEEVSNLLEESNFNLKKNTADIVSIIDKLQSQKTKITDAEYSNILNSARQILNCNRNISDLVEIRNEIENNQVERVSLSELTSNVAEDCETVLKTKNVEVVLNCIEDIYAVVGKNAFNNLCISALNRLFCISDGYIDKLIIGLEMVSDYSAELYISTESPSGKVRLSNLDDLKEKLSKNDALGTDLFSIKYFCEKFSAEATQKINHDEHTATISIKLPRCESEGIMLFRCSETLPEHFEKFSKVSIALSEAVSFLD